MQREAQIYTPAQAPENLFIRQIWSIKDAELVACEEKILPKGTTELIFNLSSGVRFNPTPGNPGNLLPACFISGLNLEAFRLAVQAKQHFVGVQMQVFALPYLFQTPAAEFTNQIVEGAAVCKSLEGLTAELAACTGFGGQVAAILRWFRQKLAAGHASGPDRRIRELNSDPGLLSANIPALAAKYNLTPRHLSRVCQEYFGQATEDTLLYRKYLSALHQVHHTGAPLTDITYACGFYDQPHFARTFKQFTGLSARQYRKQRSPVAGHIFTFPAG